MYQTPSHYNTTLGARQIADLSRTPFGQLDKTSLKVHRGFLKFFMPHAPLPIGYARSTIPILLYACAWHFSCLHGRYLSTLPDLCIMGSENCLEHTGCVARIKALENENNKLWEEVAKVDNKVDEIMSKLNIVLGSLVIACVMLVANLVLGLSAVN